MVMVRQANDTELTRQVLSSAVVEHRPEALARALRSLAPVDAARVLDSLAPTELGPS
jgi:hypothetical protein